ncbi:winged helix-turn-helix domain-containing protein [Haloplanus halobius]|uniref:winged helix-turn-helix domain-containing protein n=1 Tax=Haloplanus halobius TaxID=2934938 RepID=UPI00200D4572|nr:helix-turn-helix domain-containing protein [Haloplanus sp. XH21]
MATATPFPRTCATEETIVDTDEVQAMLDVLQDADCRAVLDATSERPKSASELSDCCDLPLSTTYRKLDALTDLGLLHERTRISRDGKHASEYIRIIDDIHLSAEADVDGGFELTVTRCEDAEPNAPLIAAGRN